MPAPSSNSASVATWTSLPSQTGAPHASSSARAQVEGAAPAGQVHRARDGARVVVDLARRADADARERGGLDAAPRGRVAQRAGDLGRDVGRAAGRGRRAARLAGDLAGLVDDDRLDLGAAEIDAAGVSMWKVYPTGTCPA